MSRGPPPVANANPGSEKMTDKKALDYPGQLLRYCVRARRARYPKEQQACERGPSRPNTRFAPRSVRRALLNATGPSRVTLSLR